MIHPSDEEDWKTPNSIAFLSDNNLEFLYNYNISPSKKQQNNKRTKRQKSPVYKSNSPEIFNFELEDEKYSNSPREDALQKSRSRRRIREVRVRLKLTIDDLLTSIPEWSVCAVCNEVFKQPMVTPDCGHTYCHPCLDLILNSKSRECPLCRKSYPNELNLKELSPNYQLIQAIDSLLVRCRWGVKLIESGEWAFDPEGCPEITEWRNLSNHEEKCQYMLVACPFKGCNIVLQRRAVPEHTKNCQFREIICELCQCPFMFKDTTEHEKSCPYYKALCPKGCGKLIANEERNIHLKKYCTEAETSCTYSEYGCTYKDKKRNVDEHVKTCIYHSLKPFILKMQDTISKLTKGQQEQQELIEKQQKEIDILRRLVELQDEQICVLQNKLSSEKHGDIIVKSVPSVPIPITNNDSNNKDTNVGIWHRLYRIIDPSDYKKESTVGGRGWTHSL